MRAANDTDFLFPISRLGRNGFLLRFWNSIWCSLDLLNRERTLIELFLNKPGSVGFKPLYWLLALLTWLVVLSIYLGFLSWRIYFLLVPQWNPRPRAEISYIFLPYILLHLVWQKRTTDWSKHMISPMIGTDPASRGFNPTPSKIRKKSVMLSIFMTTLVLYLKFC